MPIAGTHLASRNFCHLYRHPNGKLVDLRLHWLPGVDTDITTPREDSYIPDVLRPVHIETVGQLMFLFVNDQYIDVFQRPEQQFDIRLTREQKVKIACALVP